MGAKSFFQKNKGGNHNKYLSFEYQRLKLVREWKSKRVEKKGVKD